MVIYLSSLLQNIKSENSKKSTLIIIEAVEKNTKNLEEDDEKEN